MQRIIISGMQMHINHAIVSNMAIVIEDKKIKAILPENMTKHHLPALHYRYPNDHFLVPGFIDIHIHGAYGKDVMDGSIEALAVISRALAAEGVTSFLATTMTADNAKTESVLKVTADFMGKEEGAAILGVHLEGPFISNARMGAQKGEGLQPNDKLMEYWLAVSRGAIKIVTIAPELPGAMNLIRLLRKRGVIVSIGHSNATYEQTLLAMHAGCTHASHLFNAMRPIHQREPGVITALLLSDEVSVELIVDGIHLHPSIVDLTYRLKHKNRVVLVTDAIRAKCLGDGQYELGGQTIYVRGGRATLADGTLSGSLLRMPQAIRNMTRYSKCTMADAFNMVTMNPANLLGLGDSKGNIAVGKDADLVVLNADLEVIATFREGKEIYKSGFKSTALSEAYGGPHE